MGDAFGAHPRELVTGLDALRRALHAEVGGEARHGPHDRQAVALGAEVADEGAVDLDAVEREGAEVGERRVADAEVVERDADAEGAEAVQGVQRRGRRRPAPAPPLPKGRVP